MLGAGASASSNIPTAREMIWDFKRRLYSTEKNIKITSIEEREYEFRDEIEKWIKIRYKNIPENEYGYFFEEAFKTQQGRIFYVSAMMKSSKPSIGYQIIRFLIEQKIIWHFITTNFDNLIQKVYPSIVEISENNIERCNNFIKVNYEHPLSIKLHGDFRYDWIRNTDDETQKCNDLILTSLKELFKYLGLVVIGYSGRDESVMSLLESFVDEEDNPFPKGFYWCTGENSSIPNRVSLLIYKIRRKNINTGVLKITSADEFFISIYNQQDIKGGDIDNWLSSHRKIQPFETPLIRKDENIVFNFMKIIEYPQTFLTFQHTNIKNWDHLEEIIKDRNIIASFFRQGKIIALGNEDEIKESFKEHLANDSSFEYYSATSVDLMKINKQSGFIYGIYYKVFDWHFKNMLNLKHASKRIFYSLKKHKKTLRYSRKLSFYKGFKYSLELRDEKLLFILIPHYLTTDFNILKEETLKVRQNELISNIYNEDVLKDLVEWQSILKNGSGQMIKIFFPSSTLRFLIHPQFYKAFEGTYA